MQVLNHKLSFTTAFSQFYIADIDPLSWSDEYSPGYVDADSVRLREAQDFADKLVVEDGVLIVYTGTYGYVNSEISLLTHRPNEADIESYDHIVEGSLEVKSGVVQLLDCPDSTIVATFSVEPGFYRVRVKTAGLASIINRDDVADDTYSIELWPEVPTPRRVLKRYSMSY